MSKFDVFIVVCGAVLVRLLIGSNMHSGENHPPMFGDFEAQRHWMEITFNLPVQNWYKNSSENDLLYWGLDYPPLTAYHSLFLGHMSHLVNASWVQLNSSRGLQTIAHKQFMRLSVIFADILLFIPALIIYSKQNFMLPLRCCISVLLYPGLILIDHGHFQYNCISLGFTIWAVIFLQEKRDLMASFFFCLALNYKQMSLYHSFPFVFYLLGRCLRQDTNVKRLTHLTTTGAVVIVTFVICWLPFLSDRDTFFSVLIRLFPLDRGIFEDKVANVWCSLSVIFKLKQLFSTSFLTTLCALSTLVACIPSSLMLLLYPTIRSFKFSLINCSLAFYLLSYQVHEKSILLPALGVILIFDRHPVVSMWFLLISTASMFPLLVKDQLLLSYFVLTGMFVIVFWLLYQDELRQRRRELSSLMLISVSLLLTVSLNLAEMFIKPPERYPHLWTVLTSIFCCLQFCAFLVYFHYLQYSDFVPFWRSEKLSTVVDLYSGTQSENTNHIHKCVMKYNGHSLYSPHILLLGDSHARRTFTAIGSRFHFENFTLSVAACGGGMALPIPTINGKQMNFTAYPSVLQFAQPIFKRILHNISAVMYYIGGNDLREMARIKNEGRTNLNLSNVPVNITQVVNQVVESIKWLTSRLPNGSVFWAPIPPVANTTQRPFGETERSQTNFLIRKQISLMKAEHSRPNVWFLPGASLSIYDQSNYIDHLHLNSGNYQKWFDKNVKVLLSFLETQQT